MAITSASSDPIFQAIIDAIGMNSDVQMLLPLVSIMTRYVAPHPHSVAAIALLGFVRSYANRARWYLCTDEGDLLCYNPLSNAVLFKRPLADFRLRHLVGVSTINRRLYGLGCRYSRALDETALHRMNETLERLERPGSGFIPAPPASASPQQHSFPSPVLCGGLMIGRCHHIGDSQAWRLYALDRFDNFQPACTVSLTSFTVSRAPMCVDSNSVLFVPNGTAPYIYATAVHEPRCTPQFKFTAFAPLPSPFMAKCAARIGDRLVVVAPGVTGWLRLWTQPAVPPTDYAGDWTGVELPQCKLPITVALCCISDASLIVIDIESRWHSIELRPQSTTAQQSAQWVVGHRLPCFSMPVCAQVD